MPVSTNTEFLSKNIRVQNIDGSKSAFIYYEEDQLKISHVNPDPLSIPTFQGFQFDLSNKSEFYAGESMTSIYIYFDSTIGSSTTISSQNGTISGISPFGPTHFYFNYFNSSITDNITITSYNSNNTKFKTEVIPITLKTTQAIPLSFTNALTTQNYTYSNVNISFNKAVKSIGSIVSSNNPNQTITFSTNDTTTVTLTNYTTPQTTSDTLTFVNVIDTNNIANTGNVTLTIQNLQVGPRFQSLVGSNTLISQSYEYLDLEAHFTKDIIQNPDPSKPITITASDGNSHYNIPNTIRIENGNIKFNWITPAISSVTLAFNNLYSTDGTYDDGVAESIVFTLSEPPHTPVWFANQPVNLNTQYTDVEVSFNKRIQSATLGTGNIQSVNIKGVNSRGNFVFDVLTGGVQPSFQFFNIVAEDEGRNAGPINLSLGAYITSVTNATGNSDNKVLIKSDPQAFSITFNKSISNDPTLTVNGGGSATLASKSNDDKTLHYNLTNISASSNLASFGSVYASDGTTTSNLTYTIVPVNALNFVHISDTSNSLLSKSNFDQNTTYDLYANFTNQTLNLNLNGVNVTSTNGDTVGAITSVIDENKYRFSFTPTTSGTTKLNINNALDVNNFYYPLFQSGLLTINQILSLPARLFWMDSQNASIFNLSGSNVTQITESISGQTTGSITDFTYDSVNKYLVSNNSSALFTINSISGDYTISVFLRAGSELSFGYIFGLYLQDGLQDGDLESYFAYTNKLGVYPLMEIPMPSEYPTWIQGNAYNITISRQGQVIRYYVNGIKIKTLQPGENYQIPDATPFDRLVLNSYKDGRGIPQKAKYLDISIFNGVVSDSDILGYYNSLKTKWGI